MNLKRRYEIPTFDDVDSENVDPLAFCSPAKKNKTGFSDSFQPPKASKFVLNTSGLDSMKSSLGRPTRSARQSGPSPTLSQRLKLGETATTPTSSIISPTPRHVDSAPAAAGRSPKGKRIGILSRRRMTASPFTRVNPPSFSGNGIDGGLPFSIDAALSGTVPSYKAKPVQAKEILSRDFPNLEDSIPKGWMFDIYEETEEIQEQNVVVHRACNLDISDDESIASVKADRGKENIPPCDALSTTPEITTAVPASRKNMMTDEPRTPLGDLETSDFYAEGCDATSYIIIPDEKLTEQTADKPIIDPEPKKDHSLLLTGIPDVSDGWKCFLAQVEASKQRNSPSDLNPHSLADQIRSAPTVEIWESESAKGEDPIQEELGQHTQDGADSANLYQC
jgi:hypothetical protein